MRIDAHQHFWVYDQREYAWIDDSMASLRRDFLPNDLKPELERNGFQGSVVVQARQTPEETRWLLELAMDASFILGVIGWVDLRSPDVRSQLEAFAWNPKLVRSEDAGRDSMASRTGHGRCFHSWCDRMGRSAVPRRPFAIGSFCRKPQAG